MMNSIAFIIPHMGRESLLIDTLVSITKLITHDISVSVVVVSKNAHFSEEILAFKQALDIQFISVDLSVTISEQRNIGVAKVSSDYLAFIDADIALSSNWLLIMAQLLSKPDIALASAIQQESDSPTQLEHVRVLLSNLSIDCEMEFLPGRNLCLSRETFEKTGGFPPELVTCEDYVFTQKVSEFGKLFYTSQAQYVHLGEDKAFWPMAKKEVWRGQSNLASIKGRKVPMSEVPSFIAPPLFTGGLLVFLIAVILSFYALAYLAILGSSFILLVYSLRLFKKRQRCPSLFAIVAFYSLYFPARTIGTVFGAIKTLDSGVFKQ